MIKLLAALALVVGVCHADSVTMVFTTLPTVQQNYYYNNPDSNGETYNGFVGVTINGIPTQDIICDDLEHTTYVGTGDQLVYDYSTLTGPRPLQYARFTDTTAYETAAVLLSQLASMLNPAANTVTDYQYAIWNLFLPSTAINATQSGLQSTARGMVSNATSSMLVIYTPTEAISSNQEFLGLDAPEPGTAMLLALAGFGLLLKRRIG
jgi:hypothetical protein